MQTTTPLYTMLAWEVRDVVSYLVQKQSAFVSTRNRYGKIPFQLLTESGTDSQSTAFVEAAWLLLVAHPETVLQW